MQRQPTAPTVTRPLKNSEFREGQPIQINCQIQGFPKSEVRDDHRNNQQSIKIFFY